MTTIKGKQKGKPLLVYVIIFLIGIALVILVYCYHQRQLHVIEEKLKENGQS